MSRCTVNFSSWSELTRFGTKRVWSSSCSVTWVKALWTTRNSGCATWTWSQTWISLSRRAGCERSKLKRRKETWLRQRECSSLGTRTTQKLSFQSRSCRRTAMSIWQIFGNPWARTLSSNGRRCYWKNLTCFAMRKGRCWRHAKWKIKRISKSSSMRKDGKFLRPMIMNWCLKHTNDLLPTHRKCLTGSLPCFWKICFGYLEK